MALNVTLSKTIRKLLRFGANDRAGRIIEKLNVEEIAGLFSTLPVAQRSQLAEILLRSNEGVAKFRQLPLDLPALNQGIASLSDGWLMRFIANHPEEVSAQLLCRLPQSRLLELSYSLNPELVRSIDQYLPRGRRLSVRQAPAGVPFRDRITAFFSLLF